MGIVYNPTTVAAMSYAEEGREGLVSGQTQLIDALGFSVMGGIGGALVAVADRSGFALRDALLVHRSAQGGGSGIDVASAVHGTTLACRRHADDGSLTIHSYAWPADARATVFAASESAVTASLVRTVRDFAQAHPEAFSPCLARVRAGADAAVHATRAAPLIEALAAQVDALMELGDACGAPIVPASLRPLRALARDERAHLGPSGAGGGDVVFFLGVEPPSLRLVRAAAEAGLSPLRLAIGAEGARIEPNGAVA
jgi:mevalonate kinase